MACERAGRLGYLMELDPGYAAVIPERLSALNLVPRLLATAIAPALPKAA